MILSIQFYVFTRNAKLSPHKKAVSPMFHWVQWDLFPSLAWAPCMLGLVDHCTGGQCALGEVVLAVVCSWHGYPWRGSWWLGAEEWDQATDTSKITKDEGMEWKFPALAAKYMRGILELQTHYHKMNMSQQCAEAAENIILVCISRSAASKLQVVVLLYSMLVKNHL